MDRSAASIRTALVAFVVGMIGAATGLVISNLWSYDAPLPLAMAEEAENQYPPEYRSFLDIGSRFPDETYFTSDGASLSFEELFESGPTVLLLSSPVCEACLEQDTLWNRVMRPSLMPSVQEVLCLPLHYRDSSSLPPAFTKGRTGVFFDDERFRSVYRLIVMPTIISLDNQGFITAIQYGYTGGFTKDLIEAVTKYEVGPSIRPVKLKEESIPSG